MVIKNILLAAFLTTAFCISVSAQTPAPTPPPDDGEVVVINTNLIQIDAVVTGKDGKQITDLKAEDFEILENGVPQKITNFSYIAAASDAPPEAKNNLKPAAADKLAPPVSTRLRPEQVRRTIALVVDDLGLSFESTARIRSALKKFVDEQMQPNDLVAIIRTSGGIGALQQFTSDKRMLYAAIEKVRYYPFGRGGIGAFAPIEGKQPTTAESETNEPAARDVDLQQEENNFRQEVFAVGTLGALNYVVNGMRELPGRKAVVMLSDGFRLVAVDARGGLDANGRILDSLRRLIETANRASVVINTIDARGLAITGLTAADNVAGFSPEEIAGISSSRSAELFDTQQSLISLAEQTGGRAFINDNDIKGSVEKVLDDQKGYYLIGYEPDDAVFDPAKRKFNRLTVKVNFSGAKVRYRSGFFGIADEKVVRPTKPTAEQQIMTALTSPFGANDVSLRLNTVFANYAKGGSFIRSLLHINAADLKFTDEADGTKKAVFDIVAYTFGDNGVPVDQIDKSYTLRAKDDAYRQMMEKGFVYQIDLPIKKAGAYQLRVALRDEGSEKVGSASQFIEVPNLKKNRLTLSGLVLQSMTEEQYRKILNEPAMPTAASEIDPQTDTALRRFRRNTVLQYAGFVYNAKLDPAKRPQLTTQLRLFRDGKVIFEGRPTPLDVAGQTDFERLQFGGAFSIPAQITPGDYVLQIVVMDALRPEKRRFATQWVEIELVK